MKKLFPDEKIIETKYFDVHQDWEVPIPGFFILSPKRTIKRIDELTEAEATEYIFLVISLRKGMREVLNIDEVYFFQNEDTTHNYHLWIFPRLDWMEKFGRKIESVRPIINYAVENMSDKEGVENVLVYVRKMREYFSFQKS